MKIDFSFDYYFFDFFGTIMNRTVSADDIKRISCTRISKALGETISSIDLYGIRRSAESKLVKINPNGEFQFRDMVIEVYRRIVTNYIPDFDLTLEDFYQLCLQIELKAEEQHQILNTEIVTVINNLKIQGKDVFILSDFYLGSEIIQLFLQKKGVDFEGDNIIVSCDEGYSKASGVLYTKIREGRIPKEKACYMIGDNYISDIVNSKRAGFTAYYYKNKEPQFDFGRKVDDILGNVGKSTYSNYCFFLYKFVHDLYFDVLKNYPLNTVFFLAREGEFLKKLFDCYSKYMNCEFGLPCFNTEYLYVSRQATFPASLSCLENERFERLFAQYSQLSVDAFLLNLGFDENDIERLIDTLNLDGTSEIEDFQHSQEYAKLRSSEEFQTIYSLTIGNRKKLLISYLNQNGFDKDKTSIIVDVGWRGSIQDNIFQAYCGNRRIVGYYCGLRNTSFVTSENFKKGVVFTEYPKNSRRCNIWSFDSNFLERLLSASHASTFGYAWKDDNVAPIFNDFGTEKNNYRLISSVQEELFVKFQKCMKLFSSENSVLSEREETVLAQAHLKACMCVNSYDMQLQKHLLYGQMENFGHQVVSGNRLKSAYSFKHIVKAIKHKHNYSIGFAVRLLNSRGLYILSALILRIHYYFVRSNIFNIYQ